MRWLSRLLGLSPPRVPAGGRAFVSEREGGGWCVRLALAGEDQSPSCKRISPPFDLQDSAERYLVWVNGGPPFTYGPGAA